MLWILLTLLITPAVVLACTDVLVTPEASEDGSAMIAYNADSGAMMGLLYHYPPTSGKGGEERRVYEWDTGVRGVVTVCLFLTIFLTSALTWCLILCAAEVSWSHQRGKRDVQCCRQRQRARSVHSWLTVVAPFFSVAKTEFNCSPIQDLRQYSESKILRS